MGVLLERARRALGGTSPELPPPEQFTISCVCGAQVAGYRHDHRQYAACSTCGRTLFVLPISPYPRPIVYEAPSPSEQVPVAVVRPERPLGLRTRLRLRRARRGIGRTLWALVPPARWFSPVRLMMMMLACIVAGTVWFTVYWNGRSNLASEIGAMRAAWTRDLEAADFDNARKKLDKAAAAMQRYYGQSREAQDVEQLSKEVSLLADLLDRPLEDVIREFRSLSSSEEKQYIRDKLKQPAMILDVTVGSTAENGVTTIGPAISSGQETIRVDLSGLALFRGPWPGPKRAIFAARIQALERSTDQTHWVLRLVPDSGVLLSSTLCLEKLGWPLDDEARLVLESQSLRNVP